MSLLLAELEDNPFEPELNPEGPYLKYLSCLAEHAPGVPKSLKKQIKDPKAWDDLAVELAHSSRVLNSFLATSQAIDLIKGGVKINALPEVVDGELGLYQLQTS
jgi:Gly-Xaa carboxypeptidase